MLRVHGFFTGGGANAASRESFFGFSSSFEVSTEGLGSSSCCFILPLSLVSTNSCWSFLTPTPSLVKFGAVLGRLSTSVIIQHNQPGNLEVSRNKLTVQATFYTTTLLKNTQVDLWVFQFASSKVTCSLFGQLIQYNVPNLSQFLHHFAMCLYVQKRPYWSSSPLMRGVPTWTGPQLWPITGHVAQWR